MRAEFLGLTAERARAARARAVDATLMAERAVEWAAWVQRESETLREAARRLRESRDDAVPGAFEDEHPAGA